MRILDELHSTKFPFFLCCGIFDFICHDTRILCRDHEIEVNFEKMEKFYSDHTKTFREISFEKTEKFYRNFTKTLFFIILHAKEQQHKILMSWSMKFNYATT